MKISPSCYSKYEICAVSRYFIAIGDTATKIYCKLVPAYSDNVIYTT